MGKGEKSLEGPGPLSFDLRAHYMAVCIQLQEFI